MKQGFFIFLIVMQGLLYGAQESEEVHEIDSALLTESSNESRPTIKDKAKELYRAISKKDCQLIDKLLAENPELLHKRLKVRQAESSGEAIYFTPLIWAMKNCKSFGMVQYLLSKGADWKEEVGGKSAFIHAMELGNPLILQEIHFAMYATHMYPKVSFTSAISSIKYDNRSFFCQNYIIYLDGIFFKLKAQYSDYETEELIFTNEYRNALQRYEYLFKLTPLEVLIKEEVVDLLQMLCGFGVEVNAIGGSGQLPLYFLISKSVFNKTSDMQENDPMSELRVPLREMFNILVNNGAIVDQAALEYARSQNVSIAFYRMLLDEFDRQEKKRGRSLSSIQPERPIKRLCIEDIREF